MRLAGLDPAGSRIAHCDLTYGENVTYGPATKLRRRDSGSGRHAIDMAAAQFSNCRAFSL